MIQLINDGIQISGTCFDCKTVMDEERILDQYHYNCQLVYIHKVVSVEGNDADSTIYKENTVSSPVKICKELF